MRHVAARLLWGVLTLFVLSILVFAMVRAIPGDPIAAILGREFDQATAENLRRLYGLNEPIHIQYVSWLTAVLSGDLGNSLTNQVSVAKELATRIPRTMLLMAGGISVALLIALPAGAIAAMRRARWPDYAITSAATALVAVPGFWLGIVLIIVFSVALGWLPASGFVPLSRDPGAAIRALILPWLAIGTGIAAYIARVLRSSMLDVMNADYVRTARAWGVPERRVLTRHILRNAAIPVVTVVGIEIAYLLGGAIVIEVVFSYPGMGRLLIHSILARDYPTIQASILFFASAFVIVNLITDLTYSAIDPRIRR